MPEPPPRTVRVTEPDGTQRDYDMVKQIVYDGDGGLMLIEVGGAWHLWRPGEWVESYVRPGNPPTPPKKKGKKGTVVPGRVDDDGENHDTN